MLPGARPIGDESTSVTERCVAPGVHPPSGSPDRPSPPDPVARWWTPNLPAPRWPVSNGVLQHPLGAGAAADHRWFPGSCVHRNAGHFAAGWSLAQADHARKNSFSTG
jgi:hypothetical protein